MKKRIFLPWWVAAVFLTTGTTLHFTNASVESSEAGFGTGAYGVSDFNGTPVITAPVTTNPPTTAAAPGPTPAMTELPVTTPPAANTTVVQLPDTQPVPHRPVPLPARSATDSGAKKPAVKRPLVERAQKVLADIPGVIAKNALPIAGETTKTFAVPSSLILCTLAFIVLLDRADRRDPKLRKAPVDRTRTVLLFEEFEK